MASFRSKNPRIIMCFETLLLSISQGSFRGGIAPPSLGCERRMNRK